jgi:hypothetical protein
MDGPSVPSIIDFAGGRAAWCAAGSGYNNAKALFSWPKIFAPFAVYVWSIKCGRNKKLITQLVWKSRDESFKPN